ncbi:hypothetical protein KR018_005087 [Drosophila ironensis]|nr:hypothetical protein KR018_005087 [Drosophila ironensis]
MLKRLRNQLKAIKAGSNLVTGRNVTPAVRAVKPSVPVGEKTTLSTWSISMQPWKWAERQDKRLHHRYWYESHGCPLLLFRDNTDQKRGKLDPEQEGSETEQGGPAGSGNSGENRVSYSTDVSPIELWRQQQRRENQREERNLLEEQRRRLQILRVEQEKIMKRLLPSFARFDKNKYDE